MKKNILSALASVFISLAPSVSFALEDINRTLVIWWESFESDISMTLSGSYDGAYAYTDNIKGEAMSKGRNDGQPWSIVSTGYTVQFVPPAGYSVSYYVVPVNLETANEFTDLAKTYTVSTPVKIDYSSESGGYRYGVRIKNIIKNPIVYDVILNLQGGSGGTTSIRAEYDSVMPAITPPRREGYTFGGYYQYSNGAGVKYYDESGKSASKWNIAASVALYAKWTPYNYTVEFDKQGGTGGVSTLGATYDSSITPIDIPVRTGYIFNGYFTGVNGQGEKYFDGNGQPVKSKWDQVQNTILYAHWTGVTYTVKYHANNGNDNFTRSQTMVYGESEQLLSFSSLEWDVPGYNFLGWSTSPASSEIAYRDAAAVQDLATQEGAVVDLYAVWEDYSYMVKYDANGGEGAMANQRIVLDTEAELSPSQFSRDGYTFAGWSSTNTYQCVDATNWVEWADGAVVSNLSDTVGANVTMYAVWQPDTYEVYFDPGENAGFVGDGAVNSREYITGEAYGMFPEVSHNAGKDFAGWFYVNEGVEREISAGDIVAPLSSGITNLVAKWAVNEITTALRHQDESELEFKSSPESGWAAVIDEYGRYVAESKSLSKYPSSNTLQCNVKGSGTLSFRLKVMQYGEQGADDEIIDEALVEEGYISLTSPTWMAVYIGESLTLTVRGDKEKLIVQRSGEDGYTRCEVDEAGYAAFTYDISDPLEEGVEIKWCLLSEKIEERSKAWVDDVLFTKGEPVTLTHKVPHSWLKAYYPEMENASAEQFEEKAESLSGKKDSAGTAMYVWQDYVAGTDPTDPESLFKVYISMTNSVPYLRWSPDLGSERTYKILSKFNLNDTAVQTNTIEEVEKEEWRKNRFFKISVDLP